MTAKATATTAFALSGTRIQLAATAVAITSYAVLVRLLRYRRACRNAEAVRFAQSKHDLEALHKEGDGNDEMDHELIETCRSVVKDISTLEFPLLHRLSLEFALFRTYAIPSISGLLQSTGRFEKDAGKRYDDTDLLLREMIENPIETDRAIHAMERLNAIHGQYKDRISNEDMIYVLSVLLLEPQRWIQRFEWRPLKKEECDALYWNWYYIGTHMGIRNIPASFEEFDAWNQEYEARNMLYSPSNVAVAEPTVELFLSLHPSFARSLGRSVATCLMDVRLRAAIQYPDPHPLLKTVLLGTLWVRKLWVRYLMLPRPAWLATRRTPLVGGMDSTMCPRFHVYEKTYKGGYRIADLGGAPRGKTMPFSQCPVYAASEVSKH